MTQDEFWQHIRATRRLDTDEHAARLANRLAKLPIPDILAFGKLWLSMMAKVYTWRMWGAAHLVNGGCSDDAFQGFREWLILQGRPVFEATVQNPDTLATYLKGDAEVEANCSPAYDAYCAATGLDDFIDALQKQYPKLPVIPALTQSWDFEDDDAMQRRYPKLFAAYLADEVE